MRPVLAHGFGQGYDLPVPLWLYLLGSGAAVALSFVPLALRPSGHVGDPRRYPRYDLLRLPGLRTLLNSPVLLAGLRVCAVVVFGLVVAAGLFGEQGGKNAAPVFVWGVWWVGFMVFTAFVGNAWSLVSPWSIVFGWADGIARKTWRKDGLWLGMQYPRALGVWPAVTLYGSFVWFENVFADAGMPRNVALAVLLYAVLAIYGMACFGRETWLRGGEAFCVLFGLFGEFAPTEAGVGDGAGRADGYGRFARVPPGKRVLNLRPFAVGLAVPRRTVPGGVAFVALVLSGVTYDGLLETPLWVEVVRTTPITQTGGLLLAWALFLCVFLGCAWLGRALDGGGGDLRRSATAYAATLVPIAVAYQVAHYGTFLIVQAQAAVAVASDPFAWGWDLFGTADFRPDYGLIGAGGVWYAQVGLVVAGHVVAVWLAHKVSPVRGVVAQLPMLSLMVAYTVFGLWIMAQPIVE